MRKRWWLAPVAGVVLLSMWIVTDLGAAGRHDLTDFDSRAVARLETAMWRSYYAHQRLRLFGELAELLRTQYHLPFWTSCLGAYHAARAAVVFQAGHGRADYQRALPDLNRYYRLIRRGSSVPFDVEDVAKRELEWWIVHRERGRHQPGDLERALASLQAGIYQQPETRFADHAKARADAMTICDDGNAAGFVSDRDWARIEILLDRSWGSLKAVVRAGAL